MPRCSTSGTRQLLFQIASIPEQHMVKEFSPHGPDQALHEWVGQGHMWHGLDFIDIQNPQVRRPTMRLEQGMINRYCLGSVLAFSYRQMPRPTDRCDTCQSSNLIRYMDLIWFGGHLRKGAKRLLAALDWATERRSHTRRLPRGRSDSVSAMFGRGGR